MNARSLKIWTAEFLSWIFWRLQKERLDSANRVPILCYHRVLPEFFEQKSEPIYTLLPEQFAAQMKFLQDEGFTSVSLQEFAEMAQGLRPPRERSVLITFDDGLADMHALAWPIARQFGMKLNLFLCTSLMDLSGPIMFTKNGSQVRHDTARLDQEYPGLGLHVERYAYLWRPLTWSEVEEMRQDGVQLGLHSHSHRRFELLTPQEIVADIRRALEVFHQALGFRPSFFALPYGVYESAAPHIISLLQGLHLPFIFTTKLGRAVVPSDNGVFPRIVIHQQDNLAGFQRKLFGAYDWLEKARYAEDRLRRLFGIPS